MASPLLRPAGLTLALLAAACADDGDAGPAAGPPLERVDPVEGGVTETPLDCAGAFAMPPELTGPDGLGRNGWSFEDVRLVGAWPIDVELGAPWLSDASDAVPSLRVRTETVPELGACYQQALAAAAAEASPGGLLADVLHRASPFADREADLASLATRDPVAGADYELDRPNALVAAVRGLYALDNPFPTAPTDLPPWDEALASRVREVAAAMPREVEAAVAAVVVALGETVLAKRAALRDVDRSDFIRTFELARLDRYTTFQNAFVSPSTQNVVEDTRGAVAGFDLDPLLGASQTLARATGAALDALRAAGPFDSPDLDLPTPHGRLIVRGAGADDVYEGLEGVALLVDAGGDDRYAGRYAASSALWLSGGVLLDVAGDDVYGADQPDLVAPGTTAEDGFDAARGFTQGCGAFGVGLLVDGGGRDAYRASVYGQGVGYFGVGALWDDGPEADTYQLGHFGQGAGYFGTGVLVEGGGDDAYGVYTVGLGVGKPGGHGLALDLGGDDRYVCYHAEDGPELPDDYPDHLGFDGSTAYADREGQGHFTNVCQGAGWGYRHEWLGGGALWMGGFGALIDLGDGADVHEADVMSMGMGFVYGFGFLYDGGGDDRYRTFWWGPAASAHMGVGLLIEEDGDDDFLTTRASAGWGFDWGSAWFVDRGGDDRYAGQMHYGEAYTQGFTYFLELAGDDAYNAGEAPRADALFGAVRRAAPGQPLVGAFLDLGGGADTYGSPEPGPANDATWSLPPRGDFADPAIHLGIGIDR